eukprot:CAMPEP_0116101500 /NCGR_PEP_ID=MMETSP0327-20121206/12845_1 /TAXON_ID=44447 /ORGANISM="Pseudo-nitzschia delicatissima, Strain B596" /LENGTH=282 /DNA_ID=CAMNT_0003593469 /DNA_START=5 /DNA_END=853 /DNA_ORIENTATION=+
MTIQKLACSIAFVVGFFLVKGNNGFVLSPLNSCRNQRVFNTLRRDGRRVSYFSTALRGDKFNRDINDKSRQRATGEGGGEMAAGAVLGGLLGGPFGAMFGAAVGGNLGANKAFDRARKDEMTRKGITQEMLDAAEEVGYALEQSFEGMEATKESLRSQQKLARQIDSDVNDWYDKAQKAMVDGREEDARTFLLQRNKSQDSLKEALVRCAEEKKRIEVMEGNVSALQKRALEVEAILQRAIGAKSRQDSSDLVARQTDLAETSFSLSREDPLLKKFKDLGID